MDMSKTMSERKHSEKEFTNEDTVRRRAWIDKALDSVKGRFMVGNERLELRESAAKSSLYVIDSKRLS
jgi:hypothetical protein